MIQRKQLSKEQALQKLRHYCAYQERSHYEVKEKLYSFGLRKQETEEGISQLIEEGYLNEERFAKQFALGKFRMKQWGKIKIKYELKQKQVSEYCIRRALEEIDTEEYEKTLRSVASKKWRTIKGEGVNHFVKMSKTRNFLQQRGFETNLIAVVIKQLQSGEK